MVQNVTSNLNQLLIQKNLAKNQGIANKALEKLSSGKKINRSADDAAGVAIAQQLDSQLKGLERAARNASDGVSLIQTADAAIGQETEIVQRVRELTVQAASDLNSPAARDAIQTEINQLTGELGRITGTTSFNGKNLLDGSLSGQTLQVGPDGGQTVELSVGDLGPSALGISGLDVTTQAGAQNALGALDTALNTLGNARAGLGAVQNRLETTVENLNASSENVAAAKSRILDADFAAQVANQIRGQILEQAGIAAMGQANVSAKNAMALLGG